MPIVTRANLVQMLNDPDKRVKVIGRALVALYNRQTANEQRTLETKEHNNVGFTGSDARIGSICAKYYLQNNTLKPWHVTNWMNDFKGFPRICKYHRQLNEIAEAKAARKQQGLDSQSDLG